MKIKKFPFVLVHLFMLVIYKYFPLSSRGFSFWRELVYSVHWEYADARSTGCNKWKPPSCRSHSSKMKFYGKTWAKSEISRLSWQESSIWIFWLLKFVELEIFQIFKTLGKFVALHDYSLKLIWGFYSDSPQVDSCQAFDFVILCLL